jgi:hypothetical protein
MDRWNEISTIKHRHTRRLPGRLRDPAERKLARRNKLRERVRVDLVVCAEDLGWASIRNQNPGVCNQMKKKKKKKIW